MSGLAPLASAFDYGCLEASLAEEARNCASRLQCLLRAQQKSVINAGKELLAIKERLGHGHFRAWLNAEFGLSERAAQNYMRAAVVFGDKPEIVADLRPGDLYQLSARSAPSVVVEKVLREVAEGKQPRDIEGQIFQALEAKAEAARQSRMSPRARRKRIKQIAERAANDQAAERRAALAKAAGDAAVAILVEDLSKDRLVEFLGFLKKAGWAFEDALHKRCAA